MKAFPRQGLAISLALGVLAFALDRGHKFIQLEQFGWTGGEFHRVTSFFDYVLVWNTGISYGLFSDLPVAVLSAVMFAAMAALAIWYARTDAVLVRCGLALALGGALSNAYDRMAYGAVADFFHFHIGEWSFYIFNIADAAISLGVVFLALDAFGVGRRPQQASVDAR